MTYLKTDVNTAKDPQTSALSLDPVSILVYTEYADTSSSSNQEFEFPPIMILLLFGVILDLLLKIFPWLHLLRHLLLGD